MRPDPVPSPSGTFARGHDALSCASDMMGSQPRGALAAVSLAVKSAWDEQRLTPDDAVIVACSGGADSLSLALAVADIAQRRGVPYYAVSVDHGLRPESRAEATQVAALLTRWGFRASTHHYPPSAWAAPTVGGEGPESFARTLRYEALTHMVTRISPCHPGRLVIMVGHTMDDQAETVLLRLARGSGVGSLRAMERVRPWGADPRVVLVRPFLTIRRSDTRSACEQASLRPIEDPTNALHGPWRTASGEPLPRSAVRYCVLPELRRALGIDPVGGLARSAAQAGQDDDALTFYADRAYEAAAAPLPAGGGGVVVDVSSLAGHPRAVRLRALHRAALEAGARAGALSARHLAAVDRFITHWHGQGPAHLPGVRVVRKATQLTFMGSKAIS